VSENQVSEYRKFRPNRRQTNNNMQIIRNNIQPFLIVLDPGKMGHHAGSTRVTTQTPSPSEVPYTPNSEGIQ
jgi:hypothetical protein